MTKKQPVRRGIVVNNRTRGERKTMQSIPIAAFCAHCATCKLKNTLFLARVTCRSLALINALNNTHRRAATLRASPAQQIHKYVELQWNITN